jgi:hypothetical protein
MKAARRRTRHLDPLASRAAIRTLLTELRAALPEIIPSSDKELLSLLRAALHFERHPEVKSRRGRKSKWKDGELIKTADILRTILTRGTHPVCPRSFIEHYLLIPSFPEDVAVALERGDVNLFEAEQLARLASGHIGIPEAKLKKRRSALLRTHLQSGESGVRLKARVDALLHIYRDPTAISGLLESGPASSPHSPEILAAAERLEAEIEAERQEAEGIGEISPDHIFYEYLQIITGMMREVRPDEISEAAMERITSLAEGLIQQLNIVYKQQHPPAEAAREAAQSFYLF